TVVPLDDTLAEYLRKVGVELPEGNLSSRNPTPRELREVAGSRTDLTVTVFSPPEHAWQIMFEGRNDPDHEPWTLLNVFEFSGDETAPHTIWFEKGWPSLILRIVHALSVCCGPLVVIPDTGCQPIVVSTGDDVPTLLATWEHTRDDDR